MTEPADPFAPKARRTVECAHCGDVYCEAEAVFEVRNRFTPYTLGTPLWWCRNETCDGAGVGYDLHPTRRRILPRTNHYKWTPPIGALSDKEPLG